MSRPTLPIVRGISAASEPDVTLPGAPLICISREVYDALVAALRATLKVIHSHHFVPLERCQFSMCRDGVAALCTVDGEP